MAVVQPSGTVTLVFTDIESSTKLLEELGVDGYREALAEHRRVVRDGCARFDGYEVDYEGDAFFYAFSSAQAAVSAVGEAMVGLEPGPILIRVGVHTGEPGLDPPKYVGLDVHLAARIMSSAHGGQVVCSATTAGLLQRNDSSRSSEAAPSSAGPVLKSLGEHRLKDIAEPVSIFQLGGGRFPPLKTISNTNLPRAASSFVGRERELQDVLSRIEGGARLLTLTGPGGTGKTRLALEAASSLVPACKAGVFWVGLASLRDSGLVTEAIAQTLGAKHGLREHIGERELLLLLDNLEQVIEAAPELASLLEACPGLTLLCTSRELLRVRGEVEYPVPPLANPEAVELFCVRAQLEPSDVIAELCARLDSLPLALELAAARTRALTPVQILERLSGRLDLLKGGRDADPRQQTLRATIEWSYDLLAPEEQQLFARLSVFAGGCTLEAAEEVCDVDLDTLQSLVDKSLVRFTEGRYWLLETIREFAAQKLEASGEGEAVGERHSEWFVHVAVTADEPLRRNDLGWVERLEREHDNLRIVLGRFEMTGESDRLLGLVAALWRFWYLRSHYGEGGKRLERALALDSTATIARGRALDGAAVVVANTGDARRAKLFAEEALDLQREIGDAAGAAYSVLVLGNLAAEEGDMAGAEPLLSESVRLFLRLGEENFALLASSNLAWVASGLGDSDRAQALHGENLAWARRLCNRRIEGITLAQLAVLAFDEGAYGEAAHSTLTEAISIARELDDPYEVANDLCRFASLFAHSSCHRRAVMLMAQADALREETGAAFDSWALTMNDETLFLCRADLGEDGVAAAWERGRTLTVDEAIELARSSP